MVRQAANATPRGALGSGLWAGLTSFAVGGVAVPAVIALLVIALLVIALLVIALLRETAPTPSAAGRAP